MKDKIALVINGDLIVDELISTNKRYGKLIVDSDISKYNINKSVIIEDTLICDTITYGDAILITGDIILNGESITYSKNSN